MLSFFVRQKRTIRMDYCSNCLECSFVIIFQSDMIGMSGGMRLRNMGKRKPSNNILFYN